jgi:NodT family efflux transporter outer membrane factor (OMF) lipoprotein
MKNPVVAPGSVRAGVRAGVALVTWVGLAACNFAPHYDAPKIDSGTKFKEAVVGDPAAEGWRLADPQDAVLRGNWWEVYNDPDLNALEEKVAVSNQTVIAAEANYRAAHAMVLEAQASLFPTLTVNPAVTRSKSSASVNTLGGGVIAGGSASSTTTTTPTGTTPTGSASTTSSGTTASGASTMPRTIYSVPLEASYQVDLWGAIRNNVAQNRYSAEASAAQLANALLSTQSTLAQDYFQLRVADELRPILDATLDDFQANLHLVQTLFNNGLASDEDIAQAQTQLQSAMATATDLGITRAQFEHAIAVLIGLPPSQFSLPYKPFRQSLPATPVGVPADLIERRPDIAAAERQVAATNAAIGIARAAYFPNLTLSGSAGFESTALSQLFKWPNLFWSFGPELAQTLFDGGAHRAATAQAWALNEQAAANYRQAVLMALQSVEDNLASLRILAQELTQQHLAAEAAQRAVQLSVVRFRNGVDSYVNVITAQNAFLSARETEVNVQLRQLTASVNLINNLGGGWATSQLSASERMAQAAHGRGSSAGYSGQPANGSGAAPGAVGIPNPPPPHEIRPEEILRQDREAMGPEK